LIVPKITGNKPENKFEIDNLKLLKNLELADRKFNIPAPINLLFGVDLYFEITIQQSCHYSVHIRMASNWGTKPGSE